MSKINSAMINNFVKQRKFRNIMIFVTLFLSAVVLIGVTILMMKPAITIAKSNPEITVEVTEEVLGEEIPIKVKASGDNSNTCFVLTFNGESAGLSETYNFVDEQIVVTDIYEKEIILTREIGEDKAVNYHFNLKNGQKTEFELACTSGVYVITNEERARYLSLTSTDDEAIRNAEVEEMIEAENKLKTEELTEASLHIISGSGADLALAKSDATNNKTLELMWLDESYFNMPMLFAAANESLIDEGEVSDTVFYKIVENRSSGEYTITVYGEGAIPDYSNRANAPWYPYISKIKKIIIEDGITDVGENAFYGTSATSLTLGNTVSRLGYACFRASKLSSVILPDSMRTIETFAFYSTSVSKIEFKEGLVSVDSSAFNAVKQDNLHFPSTLKSYSTSSFMPTVKSYTVAEGNTTFFAEDGVLYKNTTNGKIELSSYPKDKEDNVFVVPSYVNSIQTCSFNAANNLEKLVLPKSLVSLTYTGGSNGMIYSCANLKEIVFEEGTKITSSYTDRIIIGCNKLETVIMPDLLHLPTFASCGSLKSIYVPKSVTRVNNQSFGSNTNGLQTVEFDAVDCKTFGTQSSVIRKYDLTIGEQVDYLRGPEDTTDKTYKYGFQSVLLNARSVSFKGENQITISESVFSNMPEPLNSLKGTIWVDPQGIVYSYSKETHTASVAYVPFDLKKATIPETITPEEGVKCKVNAINTYAFKLAENLEELTFENPGAIEKIGAYGISYCNKLALVNGFSTIEEAKASFTNENITFGYRTFFFTSLKTLSGDIIDYDTIDGLKNISVTTDNFEPLNIYVYDENDEYWTDTDEVGKYVCLTGNTISINMAMNNSDIQSNKIYRLYFELSELDGSLSIAPGETVVMNETTMTCYATEAPNIVYIEFVPNVGTTVNTAIEAVYPTPSSAGGSLRVWGMALTLDESVQYRGQIIEYEIYNNIDGEAEYINGLHIQWKTKPDDFVVTKTSTGNTVVNIAGDGKGNFYPNENLTYSVNYSRASSETSAYGKDYVKSVDFYDYFDFGGADSAISWNSSVVEDIKNENIKYSSSTLYAGDTAIAKLTSTGASIQTAYAIYDEEKGVIISWRVANSSATAEIATTTTTVTIYPDAVSIDTSKLDSSAGTTFSFTNIVEATTHYTYSPDAYTKGSAEKSFKSIAGSLGFSNSVSKASLNFGESFYYKISLFNSGTMPYSGTSGNQYTVSNIMSPYIYITPANMEKMFADKYGQKLTMTIKNAVIYPFEQVTTFDGKPAYITGTNSDVAYSLETLVLSWDSEKNAIRILRADGTVVIVESSLQELLDLIGYSVGFETAFELEWIVNDKNTTLKLEGGQYEYFYIYATNKDTFMMLNDDYPNSYPNESNISSKNNAYLYRSGATKYVKTSGVNTYMKREAFINKSGSLNSTGEVLHNDFSVKLDDIIDYNISFDHIGTGEYGNMPLIDDIYGTQVLLVPVEKNPQLAELNLGAIKAKENGKDTLFYKLSKSGIYKNVVVGINQDNEYMIADTISVTAVGEETQITVDGVVRTYSGLRTSIAWYYDKLPGVNYNIGVDYHTYVDSEQLHSTTISTGNIAWINDQTGNRIYSSLWGSGSILDFEKSIIVENEDGSLSVDADDHTVIAGGDSVTYRLRLVNPNAYEYTFSGSYFFDELPINEELFEWKKDVNVSLRWEDSDDILISNLDKWYIDNEMYGVYQYGKYYMKWPEETALKFKAGAVFDMYVTLTFPENTSSSDVWSQYYQAIKGSDITNTFNVYGSTDTVYHSLKEKGRVVLQKGVYGTYRYKATNGTINKYTSTLKRTYYNNQDATNRAITYYMVLYNDGYSKLYINDIYDDLPKGFKYINMSSTATIPETVQSYIITPSTNPFAILTDSDGETINYVNAMVRAEAYNGGVSFKFDSTTGSNSIKYDIEKNKYYLNHGEAIVFAYVCSIGETADTEDVAINTIGMEYFDYMDAGVESPDSEDVLVVGRLTDIYDEQNDGDRSVESGKEVKGIYNFDQNTEDDSQWLISNVSVTRGGIIPGVTNYTDSYVNTGTDMVTPYITSVSPFATINWRTRLHNSGTSSIIDYTFVDMLPSPYSLTGTVKITIYDDINEAAISSYNILTVIDRTEGYITVKGGYGTNEYQIPFDGTKVAIPFLFVSNILYVDVSITHDVSGQEILTIDFADKLFSIPESGGYADITFSTNNETNVYENTVYTNLSYLIPNVQEYDSVAQGSLIYKDGETYGVVNSSPANVSIGYSTTSVKSVEENINSENTTTSSSDKNYILLKDEQSEFKYTLTVTNDTKNGMTKLILIDSLPQVGDHSPFDDNALRNSEYKVSLSENPEFTLTVYPEDGESYVVSSEYYTIGYKETQSFNSNDWDGTAVWDEWNMDAENVRSIRLYVNDGTGEQIPAGAKIEFSFNAKVNNENATAGMIAWNSFGYRYGLVSVPFELEAMPLSVGVKIPEVPTLQKQLVDLNGESFIAEEDTSFTYRIYQGDETSEIYTDVTFTVEAGESASEKVKLILEDWQWQAGESYTISEMLLNEDYVLLNWNNRTEKTYTFIYDPDVSVALKCTNTYQKWSFEILKTDAYNDNRPLKGAVFALYSPSAEDIILDGEYAKLTLKPEKTIVDENGVQWYLQELATTDNQGKCRFINLRQPNYYLAEIKAPNGYKLEFESRVVTNKSASSTIEVENYSMPKLPYTGVSYNPTTIIGGVLFGLSLFSIVFILRKRKTQKET